MAFRLLPSVLYHRKASQFGEKNGDEIQVGRFLGRSWFTVLQQHQFVAGCNFNPLTISEFPKQIDKLSAHSAKEILRQDSMLSHNTSVE
ncbi:hypothetical protein V6N11_083912 [Hibiscus sabdariffa]|uniref:Uncharacterized protein n=1 Tax=Hibiscus sabdariffa TaxID=183260 RepID=A0ABR2QD94_9ROSI